MPKVEKTVFISYRRTNMPWAMAIYQDLVAHDYDVFIDYLNINSGDFEQIIIGNIKARAHFLIVLTPSALEGCKNPEDWLRREIETALTEERNIIPLFLEGFGFEIPSISMRLTGKLAQLKNYNGLNVPADYFKEAMDRLRNRFLNIALDAVVHPVSQEVRNVVKEQQNAANEAELVGIRQLNAQEWLERGYLYGEAENFDEAIRCYTEAIRLHPSNMIAYHNRGLNRQHKGDFDGAIKDFDEAIRLAQDFNENYLSRGVARGEKGDLLGAIEDFTHAIHIAPKSAEAYANRGSARKRLGDLDGALNDLNEAIRLKPDMPEAYFNRGIVRGIQGKLSESIMDYDEAIRLKPDFWEAYLSRGNAYRSIGNFDSAIADLDKVIEIKPDDINARGNRGITWRDKGDLDNSVTDLNYVIQIKPDNDLAYYNRATVWEMKNNYELAIDDYQKYLDLGGGVRIGDQKEVEEKIQKLKGRL